MVWYSEMGCHMKFKAVYKLIHGEWDQYLELHKDIMKIHQKHNGTDWHPREFDHDQQTITAYCDYENLLDYRNASREIDYLLLSNNIKEKCVELIEYTPCEMFDEIKKMREVLSA